MIDGYGIEGMTSLEKWLFPPEGLDTETTPPTWEERVYRQANGLSIIMVIPLDGSDPRFVAYGSGDREIAGEMCTFPVNAPVEADNLIEAFKKAPAAIDQMVEVEASHRRRQLLGGPPSEILTP